MAYEFKLPDVGEGIHEAVLVKWLVAEGDTVSNDQAFVEIETDKAVVELPSPVAGTVSKLHFKPGDLVHVGEVMITFAAQGEKAPAKPVPAAPEAAAVPETAAGPKAAVAPEATVAPEAAAGPAVTPEGKPSVQPAGKPSSKPLATPHTRALARKLGIELSTVKATGKGGRISDEDVESAARSVTAGPETRPARRPEAPVSKVTPVPSETEKVFETTDYGPVERVKISRLRQVIARNMHTSKTTLAHVTHVDEADVTDLAVLYKKVKQQVENSHGIRFTIMPFFVKAAVAAMKKFPVCNASFDEESQEMVLKQYYHVGFAADTPEGLVVPVIRDADRKDMIRIASEIADMAGRARERKLTLDEMLGAGFTITNIGAMGGIFATPVIPLPQLAILGMHAMQDRAVVRDGQIVVRKMMNLSITFDHRMIDGMTAASFLREIIELVENPEMLMLRLV